MQSLGMLICKLRNEKNLTREQLAKDICSSKYIYLIEKGERKPSIEIVMKLSERLAIDLFEYLPYANCICPEFVKQTCETMMYLSNHFKLEELQQINDKIKDHVDFKKLPFSIEIEINNYLFLVFSPLSHEDRIIMGNQLMEICQLRGCNFPLKELSIDMCNFIDIKAGLQLQNIMALNYVELKMINKAVEIWNGLFLYLDKYKNMKQYQAMYLSVTLNYLYALSILNEWSEVILVGTALSDFQRKNQVVDRLFLTHFYIAQAYYYIEDWKSCCEHFYRVKNLRSVLYDTSDYDFIMSQESAKNMEKVCEQ